MQNISLIALLILASCFLCSCASKPESSAHIYEGDAPNIRYAPSTAGGPQSVY